LDHGDGLLHDQLDDFTFSLLDSLFSKGQRTVKSIPPKCRLGFSRVLKGELDKVICKLDDISCWLVRETLVESAFPMLDTNEEDLDLSERNLKQCTSYGRDGLRAQHLMDCLSGAAVAILDELVSSVTQVMNLFLDGKCPMKLGEYIASSPLTPLVKPDGGIRLIAFCVGVSGGGEAILHAVNCLVEDRGDEAWYLDDVTIVGDTLVVGEVLELIMMDGPRGDISVDSGFSSKLVLKRVAKTIVLMDAVVKINDPQSQRSFDVPLHSALECIVIASGPWFGDWQWRLATLPFAFGGLGFIQHVMF
nr:hypothetical protein [Tanacetum cinerariifolium]